MTTNLLDDFKSLLRAWTFPEKFIALLEQGPPCQCTFGDNLLSALRSPEFQWCTCEGSMLHKFERRIQSLMTIEEYKRIHVAVRTYLAAAAFHHSA